MAALDGNDDASPGLKKQRLDKPFESTLMQEKNSYPFTTDKKGQSK
jgi:hypothetical protein